MSKLKQYLNVVFRSILYFSIASGSYKAQAQTLRVTNNYPSASFICSGDDLIFQAATVPGDGIRNYLWVARNPAQSNVIYTTSTTSHFVLSKDRPAFLNIKVTADSIDGNGNAIQLSNNFSPPQTKQSPIVDLGPVIQACPGTPHVFLNLSVPGTTASYSNQWSTGEISDAITVSGVDTYTLTVTGDFGVVQCKTIRSVSLSNFPQFNVNTGGNAVRCFDSDIKLKAEVSPPSSYSYTWTSPGGFFSTQTITVNPAFPTTYAAIVEDITTHCKDTAVVRVTINPALSVNTIIQDTTLCKSVFITLPTNASGGTPTPGPKPYKYAWTPKLGLNDSILQNPSVTALSVTGIIYKVTATDASNCTKSDVVIIKKSSLAMSLVPDVDSVAICSGSSKTLTASAVNGNGAYTFVWSPSNLLNKITETSYSTVKLTSLAKIKVVVTDNVGCTDKDSVKIGIIPLPQSNLGNLTKNICVGTSIGIDAMPLTGNVADYLFKWSPSVHISDINIHNPVFYAARQDSSAKYLVSITSVGTGCINKDSATIVTKSATAFNITPVTGVYINTLTGFTIDEPQPSGLDLVWKFQDSDTLENGYNVIHQFDSVKTYQVTAIATNLFGCISYDTIQVVTRRFSSKTIYIPSAFNPASTDERNASFKIFAETTDLNTDNFKVSIFNIFGSQIFTSDNFTTMKHTGWTGDGFTSGVYTYVIYGQYSDGESYTKTGTVTLIK